MESTVKSAHTAGLAFTANCKVMKDTAYGPVELRGKEDAIAYAMVCVSNHDTLLAENARLRAALAEIEVSP